MTWRIIGIENPARLSLRDNKLVITQEQDALLPIEDIDTLVLGSSGITMTANLLTALSSSDVAVVICDEKHLPASVLLPYSQHSRQAKVSRQQLAMSQPLKKQIWQKIIICKIENQANVLRKFSLKNELLQKYASEVKSGDSDNRESLAARVYFAELLDDATRRKPIWHNAALNYGYAIVRSHIARQIAARGLIASQGIFHRSELNSFNLADDLIEPFRAIVDYYILSQVLPSRIWQDDGSLTKQDRQKAIDILNYYVIMEGRKVSLKYAINITVNIFVRCIETVDSGEIILPKI